MTQVTVSVKDDKSEKLNVAMQKRINLLEKMLVDMRKSGKNDIQEMLKVFRESQDKDVELFSKLSSSLSSAIKKISSPKVNIQMKDNSSSLAKAIGDRISMLESVLKKNNSNNNRKVIRAVKGNTTINNNLVLDSIRNRGTRVIPSPS